MKELTHDIYKELEVKGNRLREKSNELFKDLGIKGQLTGMQSCFQVHFTGEHIKTSRDAERAKDDVLVPSLLNLGLLNRGIYLSRKASGFISVVNTEKEIDSFLNALYESLKDMCPVIEEETPELIVK